MGSKNVLSLTNTKFMISKIPNEENSCPSLYILNPGEKTNVITAQKMHSDL